MPSSTRKLLPSINIVHTHASGDAGILVQGLETLNQRCALGRRARLRLAGKTTQENQVNKSSISN